LEVLDDNDRMKSGVWVEASGGEIGMQFKLERDKGKSYRFEGELAGKKLHGDVKSKDAKGLSSSVSSAQRLALESQKSGDFRFVEQRYSPDLDPTRTIEFTFSRAKGDPKDAFHFEAGKFKVSGELDEAGLVKLAQVPLGKATITFRREFIRGKL
jgi:hypothetical protein